MLNFSEANGAGWTAWPLTPHVSRYNAFLHWMTYEYRNASLKRPGLIGFLKNKDGRLFERALVYANGSKSNQVK